MKIRTYFRGLEPGDDCTGTVHAFNLQAARMIAAGLIVEDGGRYFYRRAPGTNRQPRQRQRKARRCP